MADRRLKRPRDPLALAKLIGDIATGAVHDSPPSDDATKKNPAAVELGRRGGLVGGKARAEKLSSKERIKIARQAAMSRWGRKKNPRG